MSPTAAEVIAGWKAWCPDFGRTEDDAIFYHATPTSSMTVNPWMDDFQEAAEHYAEEHCGFSDESFESIEIYVRNTLTLEVHVVTVKVDYEPVFTAAIWVTPR